jgi:hypothetical protein
MRKIGNSFFSSLLVEFTRGDPTLTDLEAVETELFKTNDRVTAVMLGAFVETALKKLLVSRMRDDLNSDEEVSYSVSRARSARSLRRLSSLTR